MLTETTRVKPGKSRSQVRDYPGQQTTAPFSKGKGVNELGRKQEVCINNLSFQRTWLFPTPVLGDGTTLLGTPISRSDRSWPRQRRTEAARPTPAVESGAAPSLSAGVSSHRGRRPLCPAHSAPGTALTHILLERVGSEQRHRADNRS